VTRHSTFLACWRLFASLLVPIALVAHSAEPVGRSVRVGFVHPQSPSTALHGVSEFWDRMRELGYVEGQNLVIEARWAEGRLDRLPSLLADVVARKVDVIVAFSTPAAIAAKAKTSTIPIVGISMGEPLRTGLATSLARPGANLTGLSVGWTDEMPGKWLELLQEIVPKLDTVGLVSNPENPISRELVKELEVVAPTRNLKLLVLEVRNPKGLEQTFEQAGRKTQAVLLLPGVVVFASPRLVTALAAKHRLPTMYYLRDFVDAGGLVGYAPDIVSQWRRGADYVDKILRGAKPADLPIEQPTKYLLVVNLKAANALGLKVPESILLRADEVIR
jgi:putative tryptophan/tyrosine transport system substrate-binding protein